MMYPQLIREYELTLSDSLLSIGLLFRETLDSFSILSQRWELVS